MWSNIGSKYRLKDEVRTDSADTERLHHFPASPQKAGSRRRTASMGGLPIAKASPSETPPVKKAASQQRLDVNGDPENVKAKQWKVRRRSLLPDQKDVEKLRRVLEREESLSEARQHPKSSPWPTSVAEVLDHTDTDGFAQWCEAIDVRFPPDTRTEQDPETSEMFAAAHRKPSPSKPPSPMKSRITPSFLRPKSANPQVRSPYLNVPKRPSMSPFGKAHTKTVRSGSIPTYIDDCPAPMVDPPLRSLPTTPSQASHASHASQASQISKSRERRHSAVSRFW